MGRQLILRGIRDAKVAEYISEGAWGPAYDMRGIREAGIEIELETDQLEGDDEVVDRYARIIAATISFQKAFVDFQAISMLIGATLASGTGYDQIRLDGENDPPYVGLAFRVVASDGKETHYFFSKAKLSGNLSLTAAYGAYTIPQAEFQAIKDGAQGTMLGRNFDSTTTLTIPLATAVD